MTRPDGVDTAIALIWLLSIGNRSCAVDHTATENGIAKWKRFALYLRVLKEEDRWANTGSQVSHC